MTQLDLQQRLARTEAERDRILRNYKNLVEQHMPLTTDGCDEGWSRVIEANELQDMLNTVEAERDALQQQVKDLQDKADFKNNLTEQVVDLQKQVNALAAENIDLKQPGTYLPSKRETPATDTIKRQWMAEGVDSFNAWLRQSANIFDENGRHEWADKNRIAADKAKEFAAQLRQPEEKGHE